MNVFLYRYASVNTMLYLICLEININHWVIIYLFKLISSYIEPLEFLITLLKSENIQDLFTVVLPDYTNGIFYQLGQAIILQELYLSSNSLMQKF